MEPRGGTLDEQFATTYRDEFSYVWHTLRRLGVAMADLEDLAHEVFMIVYRRLADYDRARPIKPWLFGIAFRVAAGHRRLGRSTEVPTAEIEATDLGPPADEQVAARERRELVLEALDCLDLDQRAVFVLHDIDECAAPEIAAALDVKLNTVYSRLRLAREKFAAAVRRLHPHRGVA